MELILKAKDIRVEFKGRDVLDINELEVYDYDRIGLVGANGAGKSTLLRVLLGELTPPGCKMNRLGELAYIPQLDEVTLQEEKDFALVGKLGVEQLNIQTMSGGEETRLKIAQALSAQVHGILADEPTSHLDREGIDFLIGQLKYFTGALLVISHDRYFLDKIVNKVMEIDQGHSMVFDGNYTTFIEKRDQIKAIRLKEYKNQQQEIKHQQEVIKKLKQFNREKSIKRAESREKALNKIDVLEKPTEYNADMRLSIEPEIISGNDVLTLKDVSKSFGNKSLFHGLSADIFREERVALIGPNGTGKTTLLKIICKKISNNGGTISLGAGVSIGYLSLIHI